MFSFYGKPRDEKSQSLFKIARLPNELNGWLYEWLWLLSIDGFKYKIQKVPISWCIKKRFERMKDERLMNVELAKFYI